VWPWHTVFLFCSFVRACVQGTSVCASRNIVNMISCTHTFDTFSPNLHQRCTVGQR